MRKVINWLDSGVKKLNFLDIQLIKLGVAFLVLMIAKFWTQILNMSWYWYLVIAILALTRPTYKALKK